jgi:hypothetical protein
VTAYVAARNYGGSGGSGLGVLAGTYPVRIARIEFWADFYSGGTSPPQQTFAYVSNYSGASFSGGTTLTALPMRGGAPATTANVKYGYTSVSGTKSFITVLNAGNSDGPTVTTYTFPFDYILPTGSAIDVNGGGTLTTDYNWAIAIYYEELRLAWAF